MSAPELNRLPEVLEEIEFTEDQESVWEWYVRLKSCDKVTAQMKELGRPVPRSTVYYWVKKRTEYEQTKRQVLHLFNRAEQQMLTGHALNLMWADCQEMVQLDRTRAEKIYPIMLGIIDRYCKLLGLNAPERLSIEDDRRNTVVADYRFTKRLAEMDELNDAAMVALEAERD